MDIYFGDRQTGKTTKLIKLSSKTGATIAVANYKMITHIKTMAKEMGLSIPEPVTYSKMIETYRHNKNTRYLVDECQMLLHQLNIDAVTITKDHLLDLRRDNMEANEINTWKVPEINWDFI